MKRLREVSNGVHAPWSELFPDLLCAIVRAHPALFPSLYLVCKSFHAGLEQSPPSLWQAYFQCIPGYTDYEATVVSPQDWKRLVHQRPRLTPHYYLLLRHPAWPCGRALGEYPHTYLNVCECGEMHRTSTLAAGVHKWVDKKKLLGSIPSLARSCTLDLAGPLVDRVIGCTGGGRPGRLLRYNYRWLPESSSIVRMNLDGFYTIAAAPKEIPGKWQIAIFVGFI